MQTPSLTRNMSSEPYCKDVLCQCVRWIMEPSNKLFYRPFGVEPIVIESNDLTEATLFGLPEV